MTRKEQFRGLLTRYLQQWCKASFLFGVLRQFFSIVGLMAGVRVSSLGSEELPEVLLSIGVPEPHAQIQHAAELCVVPLAVLGMPLTMADAVTVAAFVTTMLPSVLLSLSLLLSLLLSLVLSLGTVTATSVAVTAAITVTVTVTIILLSPLASLLLPLLLSLLLDAVLCSVTVITTTTASC